MRPRPVAKGTRRGLTLMEVMVVVAIIGILAALLLPVLSSARRAAKTANCLSNLKQHGVALMGYTSDHGSYPLFADLEKPSVKRSWQAALFPERVGEMAPEAGVFACPNVESQWRTQFSEAGHAYQSYGYNTYGVGGFYRAPGAPYLGLGGHAKEGLPPPYQPPVKVGEVLAPSKMLAVGDSFSSWKETVNDGMSGIGRSPTSQRVPKKAHQQGAEERLRERHRGQLNMVFADAHAAQLPYETLALSRSDEVLKLFNRDHRPHRYRLETN